jgi:hypothetical protein
LIGVKLLKRKGCRDPYLGKRDDTMEGWRVGEGVNFFAAAQAQDGSTK